MPDSDGWENTCQAIVDAVVLLAAARDERQRRRRELRSMRRIQDKPNLQIDYDLSIKEHAVRKVSAPEIELAS